MGGVIALIAAVGFAIWMFHPGGMDVLGIRARRRVNEKLKKQQGGQ